MVIQELPQLSVDDCRVRQNRLREALSRIKVDRAIVTAPENVQWLTSFRPGPLMRAIVQLEVDGECTLIAPGEEPASHAADKVRTFEAQWRSTLRQEQFQAAMLELPISSGTTAVEFSSCGALGLKEPLLDLDATLWNLRRKKEPDELEMMNHAIACTDVMYRKAREIMCPGITELEVFRELQSVAVEAAGEPLSAFGNDFQCNSPGGPPRDRPTQAGELIILDLGPAYRGYHADNCRTLSVDGCPTDEQLAAREAVMKVFDLVGTYVKPGVGCRELFDQVQAMLDEYEPGAFFHHLGHGIGLYPHESPHLNPHWDDRFEEGDVFTVEPGLYTESLRAGIRIEEDYLVTATGVQQLSSSATDL